MMTVTSTTQMIKVFNRNDLMRVMTHRYPNAVMAKTMMETALSISRQTLIVVQSLTVRQATRDPFVPVLNVR